MRPTRSRRDQKAWHLPLHVFGLEFLRLRPSGRNFLTEQPRSIPLAELLIAVALFGTVRLGIVLRDRWLKPSEAGVHGG